MKRKNKLSSSAVISIAKSVKVEKKSTKEIAIDNGFFNSLGKKETIDYPFDVELLSQYINRDTTHKASRNALLSMTVGIGYDFNNLEDEKKMEKVKDFAEFPNEIFSNTISTILFNFYSDLITYGNAYVSLTKQGNEYFMYNLNAITHRLQPKLTSKGQKVAGISSKIIQVKDGSGNVVQTEYKVLGVKEDMKDGVFYGLHLPLNLSVASDYYGEPEYYPVLKIIDENVVWQSFYTDYGNNNAQPNLMISIIGEEWSTEVKTTIQTFFESNFKGKGNQNKTLIVNFEDSDTKIIVEQLSQKIDSSFLEKINANDVKICRGWRVQPKLLGISQGVNSGGTENTGSMKEFIEDVIIPKQTIVEDFFNKLFKKMFDVNVKFKLKLPSITSEKDRTVVDKMLFEMIDRDGNRAKNLKEIRRCHSLDEFKIDPESALKESEIITDTATKVTTNIDGEVRAGNLQTVPDDFTETDPNKNE